MLSLVLLTLRPHWMAHLLREGVGGDKEEAQGLLPPQLSRA